MRPSPLPLAFVACALLVAADAQAQSLSSLITDLFTYGDCGQPLCLDVDNNHGEHFIPAFTQGNATVLGFLTQSIGRSTANLPISATSSGTTFKIVDGLPVKTSTSAGPIFAERPQTLGRGRFFIGANVSGIVFSSLNGAPTSYARLLRFLEDRYLPASRDSVGLWDTPDGRAFYAERAAWYTTTTLTPDQIHEIGVAEVERIRGAMERVMRDAGFRGSLQEFIAEPRTNPRFYYETPDELLRAYMVTAKRIDPLLVTLFRTLPRTPYGVRPIPMSSAPDTTTAYAMPPGGDGERPGYFYVNLYRPEQRPKYEIPVLTLHEAMPGPLLQTPLAMEQPAVPDSRRFADYTAFVEG